MFLTSLDENRMELMSVSVDRVRPLAGPGRRTISVGVESGAAATVILLKAKLPLSARPGPAFVIEAWARASRRRPVRRRCVVVKVKVYSSLAPFAPSAK